MTYSRRRFLVGTTCLPLLRHAHRLEAAEAANADYRFSGNISRIVLENYLSRSISMRNFYSWARTPADTGTVAQYQDNLRMIANIGPKHVAFASDLWWGNGASYDAEQVFAQSARVASDLHAIDTDIIVGAGVFETINSSVDVIPIPTEVFLEFGVSPQARNFNHLLMLYPDRRLTSDSGNPAIDVTQLESKMWYFYWARRYIDLGYEHLDLGEVQSIGQSDRPSFSNYWEIATRIRRYAAKHARRSLMLISALTYPMDKNGNPDWNGLHGVADADGNLLFDYLYAGTLAKENPNSPQDCVLAFYGATVFGRSVGGITPSGWQCDHLPYTVDLDPGANTNPGHAIGYPSQWGWCEPGWFINQSESYRADWLRYAVNWVKANDPNGHFRPTGQFFNVAAPGESHGNWYHANAPWYTGDPNSLQYFKGFNDELVIKEIWLGTAEPNLLNGDFSRPVLQGSQLDWVAPEVPSWIFGSPIIVHGQPDGKPIPSGQTETNTSGIARAGSQYVGSGGIASGQQLAFLLGTGSMTQALAFPGKKSYALQISAAQRVDNGISDNQEIEVSLDGVVLWRSGLTASFAAYNISLAAPAVGTHRLRIAGGSSARDTALIANARIYQLPDGTLPTFVGKNSASYVAGMLASDTIGFGEFASIAPSTLVAPDGPWPTTLGGVRLEITDSQNQSRLAPIYYVTANAISYLVPSGTAVGRANLKLTTSTGAIVSGILDIARVSPGLFTANASGSGAPAGFWIRVAANGVQSYDYLFDPAQQLGNRIPLPVDLGAPGDQVFLSLYGTGFRNAIQATATVGGVSVPVSFAAVEVYQGEDVVNIGPLPRALAGGGDVGVGLTFDGKTANTVSVRIR